MKGTHLKQRFDFYNEFIGRTRDTMAFVALSELGVFKKLCHGPATAKELAAYTETGESRLRKYLDLMLTSTILQKNGEQYSLLPGDEQIFSEESPLSHSIPSKVESFFSLFLEGADLLRADQHLEHAGPGGDVDEKKRRWFLTFLDGRSRDVAEEVAAILSERPVKNFLDIGCGAGTYSWALLDTLPDARATLFDRENAGELVQEFAESRSHSDRITFRGGDFFHDDLGGPYDVAILSNLIHCFSAEQSIHLLSRVRESLSKDGFIAIKDIHVNSNHTAPHNALRFGVTMAMLTEGGDVYSPEEIRAIAQKAGLALKTVLPLDASPESYLCLLRPDMS